MFEYLNAGGSKKVLGLDEHLNDYSLIHKSIRAKMAHSVTQTDFLKTVVPRPSLTNGQGHLHWIYDNKSHVFNGNGHVQITEHTEQGFANTRTDTTWYSDSFYIDYTARVYHKEHIGVAVGSMSMSWAVVIDFEEKKLYKLPDLPVIQGSVAIIGDYIYVFSGFDKTRKLVNRDTIYRRLISDHTSPWTELPQASNSKISFNMSFYEHNGLYYGLGNFTSPRENELKYEGVPDGLVVFDPETETMSSVALSQPILAAYNYGGGNYYEDGVIYHHAHDKMAAINIDTLVVTRGVSDRRAASSFENALWYHPNVACITANVDCSVGSMPI